jgi:hypothetical protein
VNANKKDW